MNNVSKGRKGVGGVDHARGLGVIACQGLGDPFDPTTQFQILGKRDVEDFFKKQTHKNVKLKNIYLFVYGNVYQGAECSLLELIFF